MNTSNYKLKSFQLVTLFLPQKERVPQKVPPKNLCNAIQNIPVQFWRFSALASAPCLSKTLLLSKWPSATAKCKGVLPLGSFFSRSSCKQTETSVTLRIQPTRVRQRIAN